MLTGVSNYLTRSVSTNFIDTNFSRHVQVQQNAYGNNATEYGTGVTQYEFPSQSGAFWFHAVISPAVVSSTSKGPAIVFWDSTTGKQVLKFRMDTTPLYTAPYNDGVAEWRLEYWDGAAWQTGTANGHNALLTGLKLAINTLVSLDVKIDCSTDTVLLYIDGVRRYTISADFTVGGVSSIDRVTVMNPGTLSASTFLAVSETIVATYDTRGLRVFTHAPTANGTNTSWTGAYTNADKDSPTVQDTDGIYSGTNGQIESYACTDLSANADNLSPWSVVTAARAHVGDAGPQNLQHFILSNSVSTASASVTYTDGTALSNSEPPGPTQVEWTTDPGGGSWTVARINAMEIGVKAIT